MADQTKPHPIVQLHSNAAMALHAVNLLETARDSLRQKYEQEAARIERELEAARRALTEAQSALLLAPPSEADLQVQRALNAQAALDRMVALSS